ncbi:hypothetical protein MMC17_003304 [Xylographa soralifera]|nr:hypothetical protein [Xylographa soralifera]
MADGEIYDVLIVGGGHAGLSAALTLYRQLHTSLIFDTLHPRNTWATPTHILAGWEGHQAEEVRAATRRELLETNLVTFRESEAQEVKRTDIGFEIVDSEGQHWAGKKLLIAAGKQNVFPDIPGYVENYPERIFHCMFTFGYEHRGAASAGLLAREALASPLHAALVVGDTLKFAKEVTVYTGGDASLAGEIELAIKDTGARIENRPILAIHREGSNIVVELEGESKVENFLVHQPSTKMDLKLINQLGLELDARGDIVNKPPFFQTSVPGVFAAGDCASPFKIIPMALFMGANAAAGIARELSVCNKVSIIKEVALTA